MMPNRRLRFSLVIGAIVVLAMLGALMLANLPPSPEPTPVSTMTPSSTLPGGFPPQIATARAVGLATASVRKVTVTVQAEQTMAVATAQAATHAAQTVTAYPTATVRAAAFLELLGSEVEGFPLSWPIPHLTDEQLAEARDCDIVSLRNQRYSQDTLESLASAYTPVTPCDYAVLAAAYGHRAYNDGVALPPEAVTAYRLAAKGNPALTFSDWLLNAGFEAGSLVEAPPVARQPVTTVMLKHQVGGSNYSTSVWVIITHADTYPVIYGHVYELGFSIDSNQEQETERDLSGTIDPALVQALGSALTDLVPIDTQFNAVGCYDGYSDWDVLLTFANGSVVSMVTNGTNFMRSGGPWQTNIDGQDYMQVSEAFVKAIRVIARTLDLPGSAMMTMACGSMEPLMAYAFPDR